MQRGSRGAHALVVVAIGLLLATSTAAATVCGDVLTVDTTLEADLACAGTALVIGADGIRLDLNRHTITSTDGLGYGIDLTAGHDDVRIENGVLAGFKEGIRGEGVDRLRLENLVIRDLSGEGLLPGWFSVIGAVHLKGGSDFVMTNCDLLIGLPEIVGGAVAADGVILESIDGVRIENCVIRDAVVGVEFWSCGELPKCPPPADQPPTNGSVKGCRIEAYRFGILLVNSTRSLIERNTISGPYWDGVRVGFRDNRVEGAVIKENEIFGSHTGVRVQSDFVIPGTVIEDNDLHDNAFGVYARRSNDARIVGNRMSDNEFGMIAHSMVDSRVAGNRFRGAERAGLLIRSGSSGNVVEDNDISFNGVRGLVLLFEADDNLITENRLHHNGSDGISLFLGSSSGNVIRDNHSWNNGGWDMFHNDTSGLNEWSGNSCKTASGDAIDCPVEHGRGRR